MQNNETKGKFSEVFTDENGKKGVKLSNGQIVIPANYDEIVYTYSLFEDRLPYVAIKDGKFGLVRPDGKGTELTLFVYDDIFLTHNNGFRFLYKKNGSERVGLLNHSGHEVIPCIIDSFDGYGQTFYFRSGNHYGLWQNNTLLEPIYDKIEFIDLDEPIVFTLNGEKGYIKVEDLSFIPQSMENTMDPDEWHDLLLKCIYDQYDF